MDTRYQASSDNVVDDPNETWIPTTTSSDFGNSPALHATGINRGQWDQFMTWENSQRDLSVTRQAFMPRGTPSAHDPRFISAEDRPVTSVEMMNFTSSPSAPYALTALNTSVTPIPFGQPSLVAPPFHFVSPQMSEQLSPFTDPKDTPVLVSPGAMEPFSPNGAFSDSESTDDRPTTRKNGRKRKVSVADDDSSDKPPGTKKTSHNMIEKRYRNNLNDKIMALRECVPALRHKSDHDAIDLEGLAPATKNNKATVLAKATEYIKHLQKQKNGMEVEILELKERLDSYERMVRSGVYPFHTPVSTPDVARMPDEMFSSMATAGPAHAPHQGMIPVPENLANLRRQQMGQLPYGAAMFQAYPSPQTIRNNATQRRPLTNAKHSSVMGRVMLGGLTTLMLAEGFLHQPEEPEDKNLQARGLFAAPFSVVKRSLIPPTESSSTLHSTDILPILRIVIVLASLVYLISPIFSRSSKLKGKAEHIELKAAESVASPIELRHKAWLTAIQTVWVPRHSFLLEVAALCLKTLKLSTRKLIGWHGYSMLTGITKDQERARIKAWAIALDAQLTGGDAEISVSRLILTLLASGTLPDTPARLMLKALHIRVLLWEAANTEHGAWFLLNDLSRKLARGYWNFARMQYRLHQHIKHLDSEDDYSLPDHLASLIELDSDDVLVDSIIQRAYNLAWNRPSSENTEQDDAMDSVVADVHIASPLDALAAWWSTLVINRVLVHSIDGEANNSNGEFKTAIELALSVSPPPSSAHIRALVARAILLRVDRGANITAAMAAIPDDQSISESSSDSTPAVNNMINFIDNTPLPADIPVALTLAKCLALAEGDDLRSSLLAASFINRFCPLTTHSYSLLSFAASLLMLERFAENKTLLADAHMGLESLASSLRLWISKEASRYDGELSEIGASSSQRCLAAIGAVMGVVEEDESHSDPGYVSQDEVYQPPEIAKRFGVQDVVVGEGGQA